MKIKQYVVDAFTDTVFHGNQAAVCVLEQWLSDDVMMAMTRQNNFSETAFVVRENGQFHLRWFTPGGEIDLCGHATLATAYVLLRFFVPEANKVVFETMSGELTVTRDGERLAMDFPAYELRKVDVTKAMTEAIGVEPIEAYMARDLLCVLPDAKDVREAKPDLERVKLLDGLLLHITSAGEKDSPYDCVSRSFAPKLDVDEDPVCGSGHCHIVPYWAKKLGKDTITAYQASARGGSLYCTMHGARVTLAGQAVLYSVAEIELPMV